MDTQVILEKIEAKNLVVLDLKSKGIQDNPIPSNDTPQDINP